MSGKERRNATIADMILFIIGLSVSLTSWRYVTGLPAWRGFSDPRLWYYFHSLAAVAFLSPLSLTLLIVALRPPRARLRRIASDPAIVVGISASFVLLINTVLLMLLMELVGGRWATVIDGSKGLYFCRVIAEQTGMAIGAAWFVQALSGRWRRPRGWIDVCGWALGICWIALGVGTCVLILL